MVTIDVINREGLALPAPAPSGLWATIADSPAVAAVGAALSDWLSECPPAGRGYAGERPQVYRRGLSAD